MKFNNMTVELKSLLINYQITTIFFDRIHIFKEIHFVKKIPNILKHLNND